MNLQSGRANEDELVTISETLQYLRSEPKFPSFKSLAMYYVFKVIESGTIKSCSFAPLPASIMPKCHHALVPTLPS